MKPSGAPQRSGRPALAIGVMGSASGALADETVEKSRALGRAVADAGAILVTGACPGLPYAAVQGARAAGGLVVGISPALSQSEHVRRFRSPVEGFDLLVYTGSGLMGREVINIRSSDMVVIVGGHSGTLGEFAIAYDEGRLIGVLTGTGGIADMVSELVSRISKPTGAHVIYDADPDALVGALIGYYRTEHVHRPHVFHEFPRATAAS